MSSTLRRGSRRSARQARDRQVCEAWLPDGRVAPLREAAGAPFLRSATVSAPATIARLPHRRTADQLNELPEQPYPQELWDEKVEITWQFVFSHYPGAEATAALIH